MTFSVITRKMWHYMRNEKKRSEATQTLQAGCSKAGPKIFAQPQTPFPGARDSQNLISWRWSPSPTDPVWWRSMHAISSYRGNRPTNKQTHKQTDRGNYNTLRRCLARSVISYLRQYEIGDVEYGERWTVATWLLASLPKRIGSLLISSIVPVFKQVGLRLLFFCFGRWKYAVLSFVLCQMFQKAMHFNTRQ